MSFLYIFLAIFGGMMLPTQAGINAQLQRWVKSPFRASAVSFAVGTAAALVCSILAGGPWPAAGELSVSPWWIWAGGALGAVYVTAALVSAPKLGAVTLVALVVTGQLAASVFLDHFGLIGFPVHRVSGLRILGILLVISGAVLVRKF